MMYVNREDLDRNPKLLKNPLYALYSDKEKTRTSLVTAQLQHLIGEFNDLNQSKHLLYCIAASVNVTIEDLKTFSIKVPSTKHTNGVQPIQVAIDVSIQLLGGGSVTYVGRKKVQAYLLLMDSTAYNMLLWWEQLHRNRPML